MPSTALSLVGKVGHALFVERQRGSQQPATQLRELRPAEDDIFADPPLERLDGLIGLFRLG